MPEIRILRGTSVQWASQNPFLEAGEQGFETDTGKFKIGNGHYRWNELDYFIPEARIKEAIDEAIAAAGGVGGGTDLTALTLHINSLTPHPVYDDGPSLLLLYENGKV